MSKNDKTLSESLFAFNNHIVSMKDVIKKSKTFQTSKLVRQIKLIKNKKGNETQLEKNKRKCDRLKEEINHIKKLKFNDIAIFSFDNEGLTFEQYIKNNSKDLNQEKLALARISLSKPVLQSIEKIKNDPKIDGWKRVFIQYKARCEKRKNWKEKNRLLKEIESKLIPEKIDEQSDQKVDEVKDNEDDENKEIKEEQKQNEPKIEKSSTKTQSKLNEQKEIKQLTKRKIKFSDDETESDEELNNQDDLEQKDSSSSNEDGYDSHDDDKWNNNEDENIDSNSDSETNDSSIDTSQVYVYSKSNLEDGDMKKDHRTLLKPLVVGNKPSHMEIKQINLDEIQDLGEIPIEAKSESDTETGVKTLKAVEDPFFLDQNGNEIKGGENNFRPFYREDHFDDELKSYSSYDRYRKNKEDFRNRRDTLTRSSFRNSLSSNQSNYERKYDESNRSFSKSNNERGRGFERKSFDRNFDFKKNNNFRDRNNFNNNYNKNQDFKPKEDLSKLHPSWQAKKLMEEKVKSLKFEGKKIKFNDDE